MSWLLLHHGPAATLYTDTVRVPAAKTGMVHDTLALLARAEATAAAIDTAAAEARLQGHAAGEASGHAAAHAHALAELADARAAHATDAAAAIEATRAQATALALEVVRHIAGSLAPDAVLAALAEQALDRVMPGRVTVRVAPGQVDALARRLARPELRVLADPTLGPLDCILDTPDGRAHAGLTAQLTRVGEVWEVADAA